MKLVLAASFLVALAAPSALGFALPHAGLASRPVIDMARDKVGAAPYQVAMLPQAEPSDPEVKPKSTVRLGRKNPFLPLLLRHSR